MTVKPLDQLLTLIAKNCIADWATIDAGLNSLLGNLSDSDYDRLYDSMTRSPHWVNFYREWC